MNTSDKVAIIISLIAIAINILTILVHSGLFENIGVKIQNWQTDRLNKEMEKDTKN